MMTIRRHRPALSFLAALPLLAVVLAGCSSTAQDEPAPQTTTEARVPGAASTERTAEDWDLDFAACMRGKGIDVPDPTPGEAVAEGIERTESFLTAANSCTESVAPASNALTPGELAEINEEHVAIAQCLRRQGYEVADPTDDLALFAGFDITEISEEDAATCKVF